MPNLNLPDEERPAPRPPVQPMMPRRDGGPMMKILVIVGIIVAVVLTVVALNTTGVIQLWGPKAQQAREVLPPPAEIAPPADTDMTGADVPPPPSEPAVTPPTKKPAPKPTGKIDLKPGTGDYTIVIASFRSRKTAEEIVQRWADAGYDAAVTEKRTQGQIWYRVGVGRYPSHGEAAKAGKEMSRMFEEGYFVDRIH